MKIETRKIVRLRINNEFSNELSKITAIWRYWIWKYRKYKEIPKNLPATLIDSIEFFNEFNIPAFHPTFLETGFPIKFEENEVKLTSLEKYKRISLKIFEEDMKYLKEQLKDSKIIIMLLISPSYLKENIKER